MKDWKKVKLGTVIKSVSQTYKATKDKVIFLNTSDIFDNQILEGRFVCPKLLPGQAKKKIEKGDFLFSEIRPKNKRYAYVDFDAENYVVSTKLMVLRNVSKSLNMVFFIKFLTSDIQLNYLQILAEDRSGTFPQITFEILSNLDILLPPLPEQKAIAQVLSSLDDKIELLNEQNKTLEQMAETLFRQWFVEEAEEDWEEQPLSDIAEYLNGLACQKFPPKDILNRLPVLKIRELREGISDNSDWASSDVDAKYLIKNGDVIFSWSASLMIKIWDGQDCILNQHLFKVSSNDYPKWFYYLWTKYHLSEFISIAESHATTMGHIKRRDLDEAIVLIPKVNQLRDMSQAIEPIIEKIMVNNKQLNTLTSLRDTLLPKLMSGEVRVDMN